MADSFHRLPTTAEDLQVIIPSRSRALLLQRKFCITLQVTFNNQVATLAADLETENGSPTVANHLIFEADARAVRAQANKILTTPALLPAANRAAYQHMLTDYITVANLLQPGPGYGTTPQDDTAWNTAMNASSINVS